MSFEPGGAGSAIAFSARALRCARLRGLLRHTWLNEGLPDIAINENDTAANERFQISWSTPVNIANAIRCERGLASLNPEDDPAPDLLVPELPDACGSLHTNLIFPLPRPEFSSSPPEPHRSSLRS